MTPRRLHPWPLRLMHWTNALVMPLMIGSGWGIYNDSVIIHGLHFPSWLRVGAWAADSLLWHFAAMWLLVANGLAYGLYGLLTGRFRTMLLPIRLSDLVGTLRDALRLRLPHTDLATYNPVQKLLYLLVIAAGINQVVTGLAIWKPVQFAPLTALFGSFQGARIAHFTGMAVIVGFLLVHVTLAVLVPRTLWAMLTGGPRLEQGRGP